MDIKNINEELFKSLQEYRKERIIIPIEHFKASFTDAEYVVYELKDNIDFIILNKCESSSNTQNIIKANKVAVKIPKDNNNRIIILYLDTVEIKFNLKDAKMILDYSEFPVLGFGKQFTLNITIEYFSKDILINSPEEIWNYPILNIKIEQESYNSYKGELYGKFNVGYNTTKIIVITDKSYEKVYNFLSYYKESLNFYTNEITKLFANYKNLLVIYENEIYKPIGLIDSGFKIESYMTDNKQQYDLNMINIAEKGIKVIPNDSIICKDEIWYNNKHLSKTQKDLLSNSYFTSYYYKLINLMNDINENYKTENYEICKDLFKEIEKEYDKLNQLSKLNIVYIPNPVLIDKVFINDIRQSYLIIKSYISSIEKNIEKKD